MNYLKLSRLELERTVFVRGGAYGVDHDGWTVVVAGGCGVGLGLLGEDEDDDEDHRRGCFLRRSLLSVDLNIQCRRSG